MRLGLRDVGRPREVAEEVALARCAAEEHRRGRALDLVEHVVTARLELALRRAIAGGCCSRSRRSVARRSASSTEEELEPEASRSAGIRRARRSRSPSRSSRSKRALTSAPPSTRPRRPPRSCSGCSVMPRPRIPAPPSSSRTALVVVEPRSMPTTHFTAHLHACRRRRGLLEHLQVALDAVLDVRLAEVARVDQVALDEPAGHAGALLELTQHQELPHAERVAALTLFTRNPSAWYSRM